MNAQVQSLVAAQDGQAVDTIASMMAVIERAASNPETDVAKMERLYAMYQDMQKQRSEALYNRAMTECQQEIPAIKRNKRNTQTNSNYADLEKINDVLVPIYTKHGFGLSFGTETSPHENCVRVVCDVSHAGGFTKRYYYDAPLDLTGIKGTQNKTNLQASGSSMNYARRYLTMMIFNVATTDDDDGNQTDVVNDEQLADLRALIDELNIPQARLDKMLKWAGCDSLERFPASKFAEACKSLRK